MPEHFEDTPSAVSGSILQYLESTRFRPVFVSIVRTDTCLVNVHQDFRFFSIFNIVRNILDCALGFFPMAELALCFVSVFAHGG
jgi:hypothetical protein